MKTNDSASAAGSIALLSPAVGTPNVGDHFIEEGIRRLLRPDVVYERISIRRPLTDRDIGVINDAQCALLCGTNLYQHDWHPTLTPETIDRIRVPVIPVGVGGSARDLTVIAVSETTRKMIGLIHGKCVVGGVRDPHAVEVVQRVGVENFVLTGCPVLFWAGGERLPRVLPRKGRRVVVTARNWLMHRPPRNVDHPTQIRFLRKLLQNIPSDRLIFAIHEEWDDNLVNLLPVPRAAVFRSNDPAEYLGLYTNPDHIVVANRLHAGMLSIANGVPAVFIGHDTRTYSFCQMVGLECVELFRRDSAAICLDRLQRILDGDVSEFDPVREAYLRLKAAMCGFLMANSLPLRWAPDTAGKG